MARTYLWCDNCRRSFDHADAPAGICPVCANEMREMSRLNALVRGMVSHELATSGVAARHRTLIRMIWTANGMGDRYFQALNPGVSYSKFESVVTDYVCRAAADGWVRVVLPPSPLGAPDDAYRLEIDDEERFVVEMAALFEQEPTRR